MSKNLNCKVQLFRHELSRFIIFTSIQVIKLPQDVYFLFFDKKKNIFCPKPRCQCAGCWFALFPADTRCLILLGAGAVNYMLAWKPQNGLLIQLTPRWLKCTEEKRGGRFCRSGGWRTIAGVALNTARPQSLQTLHKKRMRFNLSPSADDHLSAVGAPDGSECTDSHSFIFSATGLRGWRVGSRYGNESLLR